MPPRIPRCVFWELPVDGMHGWSCTCLKGSGDIRARDGATSSLTLASHTSQSITQLEEELALADTADKPRILLMGPRRSGKTSIERVVFHKMSPHETLFLESTHG